MSEAKKSKKKKVRGVWYLIGSLALAIGVSAIIPKLTRYASSYLFDKMYTPETPVSNENIDTTIQKKNDMEESEDGQL